MDKFKSIREVLLSSNVYQKDKCRLLQCYEKVQCYNVVYDKEPEWGNADIYSTSNKAYIYKIHSDKSISFIQEIDTTKYRKISFKV